MSNASRLLLLVAALIEFVENGLFNEASECLPDNTDMPPPFSREPTESGDVSADETDMPPRQPSSPPRREGVEIKSSTASDRAATDDDVAVGAADEAAAAATDVARCSRAVAVALLSPAVDSVPCSADMCRCRWAAKLPPMSRPMPNELVIAWADVKLIASAVSDDDVTAASEMVDVETSDAMVDEAGSEHRASSTSSFRRAQSKTALWALLSSAQSTDAAAAVVSAVAAVVELESASICVRACTSTASSPRLNSDTTPVADDDGTDIVGLLSPLLPPAPVAESLPLSAELSAAAAAAATVAVEWLSAAAAVSVVDVVIVDDDDNTADDDDDGWAFERIVVVVVEGIVLVILIEGLKVAAEGQMGISDVGGAGLGRGVSELWYVLRSPVVEC